MGQSDKQGLFAAVLASAVKFGQHPAVMGEEQTLTYQDLVQSAGALATGLGDLGVQRGDRVGLLLPNCPQFIVSYLAITALGAVVVPVNCQLSAENAAHILNHAQVRGLISLAQFDPTISQLRQQVAGLTTLVISGQSEVDGAINLEELMSACADTPILADAALEDDAGVIIYLPERKARSSWAAKTSWRATGGTQPPPVKRFVMAGSTLMTGAGWMRTATCTLCLPSPVADNSLPEAIMRAGLLLTK